MTDAFAALVLGLLLAVASSIAFADACGPLHAPLTLRAAESRLEECNRDVQAARLAVVAASADLLVARERPNPTLELGVSNVNPHVGIGAGSPRDKTIDSAARLEQLVERGGKPQLREAQAQALVAASEADAAEQVRQQRLAMRIAFFDLAGAQERLTLQREFRALAEASADASRRRFESGEIARVESDRFRLDAMRARNDERQSEIDLTRAKSDLAKLIAAESSAASLEVIPAWPGEAPAASGERPDVRAARRRLEAAERALELARSLATRDFTVGLQADHWPASETNLQGTGVSYSLSVTFPLEVNHAYEGEAARASADLENARAALEKARASAQSDVRIADEEWRSAAERLKREEDEVAPAARDVARGAEFAYAHGATGVLDLLDARRSLKSVELEEVQLRSDAAKAWARMEAARDDGAEARR
ncbi:MAG TPA: TolC family protein [Usitatibacter sp.]|nr:TolC family protein [Usitatibacter sp.]